MTPVSAVVTIPPYAPFVDEVIKHPIVSGIRLNTVMPIKGSLDETLTKLLEKAKKYDKELWIDLKCRQLRIKTYGLPPFTEIELTHQIEVDTPVTAYFSDGREKATVLAVDGYKLIMQEGPKRVVGPGESVNIIHPSLKVQGYLTDMDKRYIAACQNVGIHNYMLSFVEQSSDLEDVLQLDPKANLIAKIESQKGLDYLDSGYDGKAGLLAARGDLYVELKRPHHIIGAVEKILSKDENAIAASRIFSSLSESLEPSCADIGDVSNLIRMGYKRLMLGDEVCQRRESVLSALNLLYAMVKE